MFLDRANARVYIWGTPFPARLPQIQARVPSPAPPDITARRQGQGTPTPLAFKKKNPLCQTTPP